MLRAQNEDANHRQSHHFLLENDAFDEKLGLHASDRWYTNGIKVIDTEAPKNAPAGLHCWLPDLLDWFGAGDKYRYEFGWALAQQMFTPQQIQVSASQPNDRFWGGWLYVGAIVQRHIVDDNRSVTRSEILEVDYGVVGPMSLAELFQKGIHGLIGAQQPQGWSNQLRNEPGMQVTYLDSQRVGGVHTFDGGLQTDLTMHRGFNVGTLFDYGNAGLTWRWGKGLEQGPIGTIESPTLGDLGRTSQRWYFLARIDAKLVAHNTFIDGSILRNAPYDSSVHSKPGVLQGSIGGVYEFATGPAREWRVSFLLHRRTPEFNVPAGPAAPTQTYGTLAIERGF